jgi:hypothetical protein
MCTHRFLNRIAFAHHLLHRHGLVECQLNIDERTRLG